MNKTKTWQEIAPNYKEGTIHAGRVIKMLSYGCYIELEEGLVGLLHLKDMAWLTTNLKPIDFVSCEDKIEVMVLEVNKERESISLGVKQCTKNPWEGIAERYPEGKRVKGQVTNVIDYGCMVLIEEGIEGIVHVSEMDWTNKNMHPGHLVSVGDTIEVMVLDVHEAKYRMSLGLKQCLPNPWKQFEQKYQINDSLTGKFEAFYHFGLFVKLEYDLSGIVYSSDMPNNLEDLKKGDELKLSVLSIDGEQERIGLRVISTES